jgi:AcrR family transcriptional regulator
MKLSAKEKIESSALILFSRQGFYETSTSEIAKEAGVSEATIFRLFSNKINLYIETLTSAIKGFEINTNKVLASLSFESFENDLTILVDFSFASYFDNLHIFRIFVSNMIQIQEIREFAFLIFPDLRQLFNDYLNEMQIRSKIQTCDCKKFTNLLLSNVLKDVIFTTTFTKTEAFDQATHDLIMNQWVNKIKFYSSLLRRED